MNINKPSATEFTKAQKQMLAVVYQHSNQLPSNLSQQFKKLFIQRFLSENLFIFIIQYIGLNLGTVSLNSSPMWFATGTSCAYLFLRGYGVIPGIFLGTLCAYLIANAGFTLACSSALLFCLQAIALRSFCYKFLSPTLIFYRLKDFAVFIIYACLLSGLISYILLILSYPSLASTTSLQSLAIQWWLGNFNGIIIFATTFLTFDTYFLDYYAERNFKNTFWLLATLFILLTGLVFSAHLILITIFALIVFIYTIYISLFYHWPGALFVSFITSFFISVAGLFNPPLFTFINLEYIQGFLCINTLGAQMIAINFQKHPF